MHVTIEKELRYEESSQMSTSFVISWVRLAVKNGIEVAIGSKDIANPNAECWFSLYITYNEPKIQSHVMKYIKPDVIVTNGETFFICHRSIGKSPFVLNETTRHVIMKEIARFINKL